MSRKQIYSQTHIENINKKPDESDIGSHCHKRLRIIITLGFLIRKIIKKKNITEVKLHFQGATIQDGRGNMKLGTEAAHNLPRDIVINGCSLWEYANDPACDFHDRVRKQIFLTSASTVIVEKEINYIDSQWEYNGLLEIILDFLYKFIKVKIGSENELLLLLEISESFINSCKETLLKTKETISKRETYKRKKKKLNEIFEIYLSVIENYDYSYRIQRLISIYKLPQYNN